MVDRFSVLLVTVLIATSHIGQSSSVDTSRWKIYKNANYNFFVKYPAQWSTYEGLTRNGAMFVPRDFKQFRLRPEMGVGASVGQPSKTDDKRCQSLEEDFQVRLNALKEYGKARNLVVLSEITTKLQDLPAVESTVRYEDSSNGSVWFDKQILIHSENDSTTYHLSLHCSPDNASVLVPLFDALCKTFRILGPPT